MLHVDLARGRCLRGEIPEELLRAYLGGRGLGVRLMRDYFTLDPFDPDLPLIFAVGPLCGTASPTSARLAAVSRSPLTETIYDCSAGGRFAWRLKASGVDALLVTGRSPEPVLLALDGERAELLPARALWGKGIRETVASLEGRGSAFVWLRRDMPSRPLLDGVACRAVVHERTKVESRRSRALPSRDRLPEKNAERDALRVNTNSRID